MKILTHIDIKRAIGMTSAIEAVRKAFSEYSSGLAEVPLRTQIPIPQQGGVTLFMPGYLRDEQALGCKLVSIRPHNRVAGLPTIQSVMLMLEESTGLPTALLEAGFLTALRTGAASGVATESLSRTNSHVLACFGAGEQAETQIEAVCAVRTIERVWIRSRSEDSVVPPSQSNQEPTRYSGRCSCRRRPSPSFGRGRRCLHSYHVAYAGFRRPRTPPRYAYQCDRFFDTRCARSRCRDVAPGEDRGRFPGRLPGRSRRPNTRSGERSNQWAGVVDRTWRDTSCSGGRAPLRAGGYLFQIGRPRSPRPCRSSNDVA